MAATATGTLINQIRNLIISGRLKSGDRLRETELCALFNVSRTPLREAFRALQSEGFLTHQPNAGVVVASPTLKEYAELLEIRNSLALVAARHAALHITPGQIRELEAVNRQLWETGRDDPQAASDLDQRFHMLIAAAGKNDTVCEYLTSVYRKIFMLRNLLPIRGDRLPHTCEEHRNIVAAFDARDPEMVVKCVDIHFHMGTKSAMGKINRYFDTLLKENEP